MLALAIFAVTLVLGLWVAFGRQIPSRYPVEAIDPPRSAIKDLLVFRAAFPILMSAWPGLAWLGGTLSTVSNHYNSTVTALADKQGLYGKVERFNQLSARVSKTLPQLEPAHMDFESERLAMIIEPVDEEVSSS